VLIITVFLTGAPRELVAQSDITPPQLFGLSISPVTLDVSSGSQKFTFTAQITDDLSGFNYGYGRLSSPSGIQNADFVFTRDSGDALNGIYHGDALIPQFAEAGSWYIWYIYVNDKATNSRMYGWSELQTLGFPIDLQVTGGPDLAPPQLMSLQISGPLYRL
jgi:hypothetical protein